MRFYFIPTESGDFRFEKEGPNLCILTALKPTESERTVLDKFLAVLFEDKLLDGEDAHLVPEDVAGVSYIEIHQPIEKVGPILARLLLQGKDRIWTAIRSMDGKVSLYDGVEPPAEAEASKAADAAASVAAPTRGCPEPTPCERRSSQVLRTFSTRSQWDDWQKTGSMKVIGNATGKAYRIFHRNEAHRLGLNRCVVNIETQGVICAWADGVPSEEEVLSIKFALEHREAWFRSLN